MKGWYKDSYRHYLASKGIATKRYFVKDPLKKARIFGLAEEAGKRIEQQQALRVAEIKKSQAEEKARADELAKIGQQELTSEEMRQKRAFLENIRKRRAESSRAGGLKSRIKYTQDRFNAADKAYSDFYNYVSKGGKVRVWSKEDVDYYRQLDDARKKWFDALQKAQAEQSKYEQQTSSEIGEFGEVKIEEAATKEELEKAQLDILRNRI